MSLSRESQSKHQCVCRLPITNGFSYASVCVASLLVMIKPTVIGKAFLIQKICLFVHCLRMEQIPPRVPKYRHYVLCPVCAPLDYLGRTEDTGISNEKTKTDILRTEPRRGKCSAFSSVQVVYANLTFFYSCPNHPGAHTTFVSSALQFNCSCRSLRCDFKKAGPSLTCNRCLTLYPTSSSSY